jgi:hypothetical protein
LPAEWSNSTSAMSRNTPKRALGGHVARHTEAGASVAAAAVVTGLVISTDANPPSHPSASPAAESRTAPTIRGARR